MKSVSTELSALFEMTPDLVCIAGKDGFFKKVNPAVIEKLGCSEKELFSSPICEFIHPEDRSFTSERRKHLLGGKALMNFQNPYWSKGNGTLWFEWTSIYFPHKEIVFAVAKDISYRKSIELAVHDGYRKYKHLAAHFKYKMENDKRNLSYELRENVAQLAAVIKMDIDQVSSNEGNLSDSSKEIIEHAMAVSGLLIKTIQKMSFSISPYMMADLGFNETLGWLCCEFSKSYGIPCRF